MISSHSELVRLLKENANVDVVVEKEIVDEIQDSSPQKVLEDTGRKHRMATEYRYDTQRCMAFFVDKIVFSTSQGEE